MSSFVLVAFQSDPLDPPRSVDEKADKPSVHDFVLRSPSKAVVVVLGFFLASRGIQPSTAYVQRESGH